MRSTYTGPTIAGLAGLALIAVTARADADATFVGGLVLGIAVLGAALAAGIEIYLDRARARQNLRRQLAAAAERLGRVDVERTLAIVEQQRARATTNGHGGQL